MIKKIPKRIKNNKIIYILSIILLLLLGGIIFLNKINYNVEEKHNQDITKYYFKDSKYNGISSKFIERKNAKENKEYDKADILRDKISNLGFVVIDEKQGSRIERKEN